MAYKRSILISGSLILTVICVAVVTFYFSLGPCQNGSFACDNGTVCVPQRSICNGVPDCLDSEDESPLSCGKLYGSVALLTQTLSKANKTVGELRENCEVATVEGCTSVCSQVSVTIFCFGRGFTEVPRINFRGRDTPSIRFYLAENRIKLNQNSLESLSLVYLNLKWNHISSIPPGLFRGQRLLEKLFLEENDLEEVEVGTFTGLQRLEWLFLGTNKLRKFPLAELQHMDQLLWLNLSRNHLTLADEEFPPLPNILELLIDYNMIEEVGEKLFKNLPSLHMLNLNGNRIRVIHPLAFVNLVNLRELLLAENQLTVIPGNLFATMGPLEALNLNQNSIQVTEDMVEHLMNLKNLSFMNLAGIHDIAFEAINSKLNLQYVIFDKFYFCSMTPNVRHCKPNSDGISSLENLLTKSILRSSAWIMVIIACFGNGLVLWGRFTLRDENRSVSLVIRNLAISDLLMGFYLFIIAFQDSRFRNIYHEEAHNWTTSWGCVICGILGMVSSEVSMLILAFMSIERFLLIADPCGGHHRMNYRNVLAAITWIWIAGITIALIPVIFWRKSSTKFYGTYSGTCFPLHMEEKYPLGWQYSAFIFFGINLSLLILMAALYSALLYSIWRTRRATPLAVLDCEFAIRFFFIVLTNATCWAPIIVLKFMVFFSQNIIGDIYAWIIVFVLPLNSAINPLLYTFTTPRYRDRIVTKGWQNVFRSKDSHQHFILTNGNCGSGNGGTTNNNSNSNQDDSSGKSHPMIYANGNGHIIEDKVIPRAVISKW